MEALIFFTLFFIGVMFFARLTQRLAVQMFPRTRPYADPKWVATVAEKPCPYCRQPGHGIEHHVGRP